MARSFPDLLRAMSHEAQINIFHLRQCAEIASDDRKARHAVINLLHSEHMRLDLLQATLAHFDES